MKNNKKNGMAIVTVLCVASIIMALGTIYVRHYSQTSPEAKLQYDRIQADFFAKGIQNIALYKIKKYPDFFIRSYRQYIYWKRTMSDASLPKLTAEQETNPMPFIAFMNNGVLAGDYSNDFVEPLEHPVYTTDIALISSKDFQSESIKISVDLKLNESRPANKYSTVVSGELKINE